MKQLLHKNPHKNARIEGAIFSRKIHIHKIMYIYITKMCKSYYTFFLTSLWCAHVGMATSVSWQNDVLLSCGDDHTLRRCVINNENMSGHSISIEKTFVDDIYPMGVYVAPPTGLAPTSGSAKTNDVILVTTSTGKLLFQSKGADKWVDAHRGAVLCAQWSADGTALATGGEEGIVKVWSRNGMLRSTLSTNALPIYGIAWGSTGSEIAYTVGLQVHAKSVQAQQLRQWKAHDEIITALAWNGSNNLLLTGSEDCKYKLWDIFGQQLYSSAPQDFPITSLAWSPDGELFAVGSYNSLRLCDKNGWSYSMEKLQTQSILSLTWSNEGTQVAAACGTGALLVAPLVERKVEWRHLEAITVGRRSIVVNDVNQEVGVKETLDFSGADSITAMSLQHDHLIVCTSSLQCFVYKTNNWNTPLTFHHRKGAVFCIAQASRVFCLVDGKSVTVYQYDGCKLLSGPKWPGMRPDMLSSATISISNQVLVVRDKTDEKALYIFNSQTGKLSLDGKPYLHKMDIVQVSVDQTSGGGNAATTGIPEAQIAFLDKNRDLYLLRIQGKSFRSIKISAIVYSVCWCETISQLAATQDGKIIIWNYPAAVWISRELLHKTASTISMPDLGTNSRLMLLVEGEAKVRRADGATVDVAVTPAVAVLHGFVAGLKWSEALKLTTSMQVAELWACIAAMAMSTRQLAVAKDAFAALGEIDQVEYIELLLEAEPGLVTNAAIQLYCSGGYQKDAVEAQLLQANQLLAAIMLNIHAYRWERALSLAMKHDAHMDVVLGCRNQYLQRFDRKETNVLFQQSAKKYDAEEIKWEEVQKQIAKECLFI